MGKGIWWCSIYYIVVWNLFDLRCLWGVHALTARSQTFDGVYMNSISNISTPAEEAPHHTTSMSMRLETVSTSPPM